MKYKKYIKKVVSIGLATAFVATSCYTTTYAMTDSKEAIRNFIAEADFKKVSGSTNGGLAPTVFEDAYASQAQKKRTRSAIPASYDLRNKGLSTVIKNQAPWGSCWSFGALSALESNMLIKRGALGSSAATTPDYSELQLAWSAYSTQTSESLQGSPAGVNQVGEGQVVTRNADKDRLDEGGNVQGTIAILAAWQGAANETDIPYQASDGSKNRDSDWSVSEEKRNMTAVQLQNVDFLPDPITYSGTPSKDTYTYHNDATMNIKSAIMNKGVVNVSYYADQSSPDGVQDGTYFNYTNWCQYVDTFIQPNHAVSIVGWDDAYSKDNFNADHKPSQDGAWLVKNSWGTGWGIDEDGDHTGDGYFWLSYYDYTLGNVTSLQGEEVGKYTKNYQYDYLNLRSGYELREFDQTSSIANVFTATDDEQLKAVSAVTMVPGASVTVEVYKLPSGKDSNPLANNRQKMSTKTVTIPYSGYHTIELDNLVPLASGETFVIIETIKDTSGKYYLPIELASIGLGQTAVCNAKESYIIDGGEAMDIYELNAEDQSSNPSRDLQYGNAMIKAFTLEDDKNPAPTVSSLTYEMFDKANKSQGIQTYTDIDNSNITLLPGVASIKITNIATSDSSIPSITVKGNTYNLGDFITRVDFTKTDGNTNPIVITTKSKPIGTNTKTFTFAFKTSPITITNNGITLLDTGYHLASDATFIASDVNSGTEFEAIKLALTPLGGVDKFKVYNLGVTPPLASNETVRISLTTDDSYDASEKTKLYYVSINEGIATLTEIANDSQKTKILSGDVNSMGYYVLTQIKEAPTVPSLSAITYAPNQVLADVSLPAVEGGTWTWDTGDMIPTVNVTSYPATFTPNSDSKYRDYQANIKLTVNKATPVFATTAATSITYGQKLMESTLTGSASCNGVNVPGSISWQKETCMPTVSDSNTTAYNTQFIPTDTINYNSATATQKVIVAKKAITVTANNASKVYGDVNPTFTYSIPDGALVGNDTKTDLAVTLTCSATTSSSAGTTVDIVGSSTAINYAVTVNTATLTIHKRPVGCTVKDVTIQYGQALPAHFEYTISNLVNGDTATSIGAMATIKPANLMTDNLAGRYELQITDFTVTSPNYTAGTTASGVLMIEGVSSKHVDNNSSLPSTIATLFEVNGNLEGTEVITIKDIKNKNTLSLFKEAIKDGQNLENTFDLSLVGLKTELKGALTITIPVDTKYNGKQVTVLHYVEAGKLNATNHKASENSIDIYENLTVVDGKVQIQVYSLSPFALITPILDNPDLDSSNNGSTITQVTNKPVSTGDHTAIIGMAILGLGALATITMLSVKKSKKMEN